LENCEVLYLDDLSCLDRIMIGNTRTSAMIDGGMEKVVFSQHEFTDYVTLNFYGKFKELLKHSHNELTDRSPFERLLLKDVTSIVFVFEDGTEKQLYVPWKGEGFGSNKAMTIKFNEFGDVKQYTITFDEALWITNCWLAFKRFIHRIQMRIWQCRNKYHQRNIARKIVTGEIKRKYKSAVCT